MTDDRLFVPLHTEHYRNFERHGKDVELRALGYQYNTDTVYRGRAVELRRGYSTDDSLWGEVGDVVTAQTIETIADIFGHERIVPNATYDEYVEAVRETLGNAPCYIAFEVLDL